MSKSSFTPFLFEASDRIFEKLEIDQFGVMTFRVNNIPISMANGLRRSMFELVDTVGFHYDEQDHTKSTISVTANTSVMITQMFMHRLSMVPIIVPNPRDFPVDNYEFRIDVKNESSEPIPVTSGDIRIFEKTTGKYLSDSETRRFFPPDPITGDFILLNMLMPNPFNKSEGERISAVATAIISNGLRNAHFIPTSKMTYKYVIDESRVESERNRYLEHRRQQVREKLSRDMTEVEITRARGDFETIEKYRTCFFQDTFGEPTAVEFAIESVGALPVNRCIDEAISGLIGFLTRIRDKIHVRDAEFVRIEPTRTRMKGGWDIIFTVDHPSLCHTLGNLMQSRMFGLYVNDDRYPREIASADLLNFIGYEIVHPLKNLVMLTLQYAHNESSTRETVYVMLENGINSLIESYTALGRLWTKFSESASRKSHK
jgi:DNA-directed RNA polymerase subunit L